MGGSFSRQVDLSVIIPTLNEEGHIDRSIRSTRDALSEPCRRVEVIVVDAGSTDDTVAVAKRNGARVISCSRGRGLQQDLGSRSARGEFLLFLHADSELPSDYDSMLYGSLSDPTNRARDKKALWGAFKGLSYEGGGESEGALLRVVEAGVQMRTKLFGLPYGDQCFFFHRDAYRESGGFRHIPLMEDYDIVLRQKRRQLPPLLLDAHVKTSSRRFAKRGVWGTVVTNQAILCMWHMGVAPDVLSQVYYGGSGRADRGTGRKKILTSRDL